MQHVPRIDTAVLVHEFNSVRVINTTVNINIVVQVLLLLGYSFLLFDAVYLYSSVRPSE